jgi:predicted 3-demethylubiquinone-9 3-methyltransferase (glyoxalase superfamily)
MTSKVTPFMMFNNQLEAALELYTATFPGSTVKNVTRNGKEVVSAELVVGGQPLMAYNGGPHFSFSEGISFFVSCEDQKEVDAYWGKLLEAGAKPSQCGWIRDPFGVSWQIVPKRFMELMNDQNPKKAKAVVDAMLKMVKLDVAALEKAHAEA